MALKSAPPAATTTPALQTNTNTNAKTDRNSNSNSSYSNSNSSYSNTNANNDSSSSSSSSSSNSYMGSFGWLVGAKFAPTGVKGSVWGSPTSQGPPARRGALAHTQTRARFLPILPQFAPGSLVSVQPQC